MWCPLLVRIARLIHCFISFPSTWKYRTSSLNTFPCDLTCFFLLAISHNKLAVPSPTFMLFSYSPQNISFHRRLLCLRSTVGGHLSGTVYGPNDNIKHPSHLFWCKIFVACCVMCYLTNSSLQIRKEPFLNKVSTALVRFHPDWIYEKKVGVIKRCLHSTRLRKTDILTVIFPSHRAFTSTCMELDYYSYSTSSFISSMTPHPRTVSRITISLCICVFCSTSTDSW